MKSRPVSAATGSAVIPVSCSGSSGPSAKSALQPSPTGEPSGKALVMHGSCYTPPRLAHAFLCHPLPGDDRFHHHPICPLADRFPPYRRRPHRAVQLALRSKLGGKMLLRIEDTDRQRSTKEAIDAILDGLKWLELDWDGDVIYQFSRAARHREVAEALLASGKAYHCYATPEELTAMREKARAEGRTRLYDGLWRDRDPSEAPAGMKPTIRLKAPQTGETVIEDQVQGRVVWQNENLDDLVLLRGDGNADLHARGGGRRSRHGRHPHHPRRRSSDQRRAPEADLRGAGLGRAEHVAYSADPRPRRLETVEAPRRARASMPTAPWDICRRRCAIIWSGSAGAMATRRSFRPQEMIEAFDLVRHRPLGGAIRFRQAGKPQRPLHPPRRRSISRDHVRGRAELRARPCRPQGEAQRHHARAIAAGDAEPEGARQDADRTDRQLLFHLCRPAARGRAEGGGAFDAGKPRIDRPASRGAGGRHAVDRGNHRIRDAQLRRDQQPQAWRGRPAAARGADRAHHLAGDIRGPGGARPGGMPGPARRSGGLKPSASARDQATGPGGHAVPPSCSAHGNTIPI